MCGVFCRDAIAQIDDIIHDAEQLLQQKSFASSDDGDLLDDSVEYVSEEISIVRQLFNRSESFRSKINPQHMREIYAQVCSILQPLIAPWSV